MKIGALLFTAAMVATMGAAGTGCKAKASVGSKTPAAEPKKEEPKPEPKKEEPPPPPPPAPKEEPRLVGLPLTGSQIDVVGTIEFDTNSADIRQTPQTLGILNTVANAGKVYTQITKLRVEGHTDSDGDDAANQNLSERRAQSVVRWLTDHGIAPSRLVAVGCGERDPLASNSTDEGKQRNRRTEFDIEEIGGGRFELATRPCDPNPQRRKFLRDTIDTCRQPDEELIERSVGIARGVVAHGTNMPHDPDDVEVARRSAACHHVHHRGFLGRPRY